MRSVRSALTDTELDEYDKFVALHFANCLGNVTIEFDNGGGIGTAIFVECSSCREKKDITDLGSW